MLVISIFSEISKIMSNMLESPDGGMYLDPKALPFHLCSLMIFTTAYIAFSKNKATKQTVINFAAVAGTLGSICAILIPTNGTDFKTVLAYQCFVYHGALLWFSLYLLITKQACLSGKTLLINISILLLLGFSMIYINSFLSVYDTNFMYLVRPPMDNLPYLNLDKGWYVYFIRLAILGIALFTIFHLPFIIHKKRK